MASWVDLRTSLDMMARVEGGGETTCPCKGLNPPVQWPVTTRPMFLQLFGNIYGNI